MTTATGTEPITNDEDVIYSSDVIARIEYLGAQFSDEEQRMADFLRRTQAYPETRGATCGDCRRDFPDIFPGRCPYEDSHDEAQELRALTALAAEGEDCAPDWRYGESAIRDSYFTAYAQELADDLCRRSARPARSPRSWGFFVVDATLARDLSWPFTCIDWDRAARELLMDYTAIDFAGETYWVRGG